MYSYPIWLLFFLILPLALFWIWKYKSLRKYAQVLGLTVIGCLAVSIPWDILSVNNRIWYFSKPHIFGLWLLGLPLEEYVYIAGVGLLACSVTVLLWDLYGEKQ
jgi:lycopene cyclase domain-containing protein